MIQLVSNVLIGNLDGAVFRYILLMDDFIDEVEWRQVEDFRAFASVVYPFLTVSVTFNLPCRLVIKRNQSSINNWFLRWKETKDLPEGN